MKQNKKGRGNMIDYKFEFYWNSIPIGKENAIDYPTLALEWGRNERTVRRILHDLSCFDNGDNYILVRSASKKGFYRTDDSATIRAYRKECLNKGKSIFAPIKKIDRIIKSNADQMNIENNMRLVRESKGMKQSEVCKRMKVIDRAFDNSLLSKMENAVCLPTPFQLSKLSEIYGCDPAELVNVSIYG